MYSYKYQFNPHQLDGNPKRIPWNKTVFSIVKDDAFNCTNWLLISLYWRYTIIVGTIVKQKHNFDMKQCVCGRHIRGEKLVI